MKRLALGIALIATLAFAGTAAAADPPTTPTGYAGAANMVNVNARPGMMNAMTHDANGHGNGGMWCAVYITNGVQAPSTCSAVNVSY